jgi:hypothetical protein
MINICGFYNSDINHYCNNESINCGFCEKHYESFIKDGEDYFIHETKYKMYNINHYICDYMKKMCLESFSNKKIMEMTALLYSIRIGIPYIFDKEEIEKYCLNYIKNYELIKIFNKILIQKNINKIIKNKYCNDFISKLKNEEIDSSNKDEILNIYYCQTYYDINILPSFNKV